MQNVQLVNKEPRAIKLSSQVAPILPNEMLQFFKIICIILFFGGGEADVVLQYGYRRKDGVNIIPMGCLKD